MISPSDVEASSSTPVNRNSECYGDEYTDRDQDESVMNPFAAGPYEKVFYFDASILSLAPFYKYSFISFWFAWVVWLGSVCRIIIRRMLNVWLIGGFLLCSKDLIALQAKRNTEHSRVFESSNPEASMLSMSDRKMIGSKKLRRYGLGANGMESGKVQPSVAGTSASNDGAPKSAHHGSSTSMLHAPPPNNQRSSRGGPSSMPPNWKRNAVPSYLERIEMCLYRHFLFLFLVLYLFLLRDRIALLLGRNPLTIECTGFLFWQLLTEEFDIEGNGDVTTVYSISRACINEKSGLGLGNTNFDNSADADSAMIAFLNHHKYPPHYVAAIKQQSRQLYDDGSISSSLKSLGLRETVSQTRARRTKIFSGSDSQTTNSGVGDVKDTSHLLQLFYNLQHACLFSMEHIIVFFVMLFYAPLRVLSVINLCAFAVHTAKSSCYSCLEMAIVVVLTAAIATHNSISESTLQQWHSMPIDPIYASFVVSMSIALSLKEWTPVVRRALTAKDIGILFRRPSTLAKAWEEALPSKIIFGGLISLHWKLFISDILWLFHPVTDRGSFVGLVWCYGLIVAEWAVGMRAMGIICILLTLMWWWMTSFCTQWMPLKESTEKSLPTKESSYYHPMSTPKKNYDTDGNAVDSSTPKDDQDNLFSPHDIVPLEVDKMLRWIMPPVQIVSLIVGFVCATNINPVIGVWLSNSFKALVPLLFIHRRRLMNIQNNNASMHLFCSEMRMPKGSVSSPHANSHAKPKSNKMMKQKSGRSKEKTHSRHEASHSVSSASAASQNGQFGNSSLTFSPKPSLLRAARFCAQYLAVLIFYEWLTFDTPYGFISRKEHDVVDLYYRSGGRGVPKSEWCAVDSPPSLLGNPTTYMMNGKQIAIFPGQSLMHFSANRFFAWLAPTPQNLRYIEMSLLLFVLLSESVRWIFLYWSTRLSLCTLTSRSSRFANKRSTDMSTKLNEKDMCLSSSNDALAPPKAQSKSIMKFSELMSGEEEQEGKVKMNDDTLASSLTAQQSSVINSARSRNSNTYSASSTMTISTTRMPSVAPVKQKNECESEIKHTLERPPSDHESPEAFLIPQPVSITQSALEGSISSNPKPVEKANNSNEKHANDPRMEERQNRLEKKPKLETHTEKRSISLSASCQDKAHAKEAKATRELADQAMEETEMKTPGRLDSKPETATIEKDDQRNRELNILKDEEEIPKVLISLLPPKAESSSCESTTLSNPLPKSEAGVIRSEKSTEESVECSPSGAKAIVTLFSKEDPALEKQKSFPLSFQSPISSIPSPRSKTVPCEKTTDNSSLSNNKHVSTQQSNQQKGIVQHKASGCSASQSNTKKNTGCPQAKVEVQVRGTNGVRKSGKRADPRATKPNIATPVPLLKSKPFQKLAKSAAGQPTEEQVVPPVVEIDENERNRLLQELVDDGKLNLSPEGNERQLESILNNDINDGDDSGWTVKEIQCDDGPEVFMRCETTNSFSFSAMGNMSCCFSTAAQKPAPYVPPVERVDSIETCRCVPLGEKDVSDAQITSTFLVQGSEREEEPAHGSHVNGPYSRFERSATYQATPHCTTSVPTPLPSDYVFRSTSAPSKVSHKLPCHMDTVGSSASNNTLYTTHTPDSLPLISSPRYPSTRAQFAHQEEKGSTGGMEVNSQSFGSSSGRESGLMANQNLYDPFESRTFQRLKTPLPTPLVPSSGGAYPSGPHFVNNADYTTPHRRLSPYQTPPPPPSPPLSHIELGSRNGNASSQSLPQMVHYSNPPGFPIQSSPPPHTSLVGPPLYTTSQNYAGETLWLHNGSVPSIPAQFVTPINYTPVYIQTANVVGATSSSVKIMATQDSSGALVYQQVPVDQLQASPIYVMLQNPLHVGSGVAVNSSSPVNYSGQPIMYSQSNPSSPISNPAPYFVTQSNSAVTAQTEQNHFHGA